MDRHSRAEDRGSRVPGSVAGADGRTAGFQVRFHGRGGQGVVAAAEILSMAAFDEGRYAQAFPSFGSERMGAPVVSYCRIDDRPIRTHEPITEPDALLVQDPTLVHQVDLFSGVGDGAYLLVNTSQDIGELGSGDAGRTPVGRPGGHLSGDRPRARSTSAVHSPTPPCSEGSPPSPAASRSTHWRRRSRNASRVPREWPT